MYHNVFVGPTTGIVIVSAVPHETPGEARRSRPQGYCYIGVIRRKADG